MGVGDRRVGVIRMVTWTNTEYRLHESDKPKMSIKITLVLLLISGLPNLKLYNHDMLLCNSLCPVLHDRSVEVNAQTECSPVGANSQTAVRDHRFYLNTAHPAPCSGTIDRWRYCLYRPADTSNSQYYAEVAVYRPVGTGDGVRYERVSDTFRISRNRNRARSRSFRCYNFNINSDITIKAGDFVAACIYNPAESNRGQLDLVGQNRSTVGYSLLQMNDVSGCGDISLPSSVSSSQLSSVDSRILHIFARIESMFALATRCSNIHIATSSLFLNIVIVVDSYTSTQCHLESHAPAPLILRLKSKRGSGDLCTSGVYLSRNFRIPIRLQI